MTENTALRSDWQLIKRLLPLMKADWRFYLTAFLAAPVSTGMVVIQPLLLKIIIDDYITPGKMDGLQSMALWFLAAILAAFLMEIVYGLTMSYGAMRTIARLRDHVYRHTLSLSQSFFDREPTGRLLTRATSDIEALGETLTFGAITIVLDLLLVIGILFAMFSLSPKLTVAILVFAPIIAIAINTIRKVLRTLYLEVRTTLATLNAFLSERLTGIAVVQLYANEEQTLKRFDEKLTHYRSATVKTNIWDAFLYALINGLSSMSIAFVLWYATRGGLDEAITIGLLMAFIDYITKVFRPIQEFSQKVATIQRATSALEKIFSLLDINEHISSGPEALPQTSGHLEMQGVTFSYDQKTDILHELSLEIKPGEKLAVVGRTGSGKTTIGRLIARSYQGFEGQILLDGKPTTHYALSALRKNVGVIQQDVQLFPRDVRFNLRLGKDISDADLNHALRLAQANDVVSRLGGLGGFIAHGASNLSVGEAQLLSIARVLAHNPSLIILDEATASVDSLTEARIEQATQSLMNERTVIVIAHRLSTIMGSDRIAFMDHGKLIELGSHDELIKLNGHYAELFHSQFEQEAQHYSA